jgi:hypothetical protein
MKPQKKFLLRINPDLYDAIEAWAQQELRSVNGQIEYVLKEAVNRRRKLQIDLEPEAAGRDEGRD